MVATGDRTRSWHRARIRPPAATRWVWDPACQVPLAATSTGLRLRAGTAGVPAPVCVRCAEPDGHRHGDAAYLETPRLLPGSAPAVGGRARLCPLLPAPGGQRPGRSLPQHLMIVAAAVTR